jgi:carboxyl-terminal processing protease
MISESDTKPVSKMKLIQKLCIWVAIIAISANVGYRMGKKQPAAAATPTVEEDHRAVANTAPPQTQNVDFALFWDVWNRLQEKYVDKTKLNTQKMVDGAISGMVSALGDPYTLYLPPKENTSFKSDLNGTFEGIGAELGAKDEHIIVISPLKDSPAEKAGIKPGDAIVKVNDAETSGWTVPQAVEKIRGPKGTSVKLTVFHEGGNQTQDVNVIRDTILVKSVEVSTKTQLENCTDNCAKVALVKLSRFGDQTNDEWNKAVADTRQLLDGGGVKGVVLDLRNNPGGYLQSAIYIASEFIKSGVVVQQENSDSSRETYSVTRVGNLLDVPLTVLINKGSASAAEILSGALHDHTRAKLIGETSFGKGSIQTPEDLPNGAGLHITTARWITPNGAQINGKGITPDFEVKSATDPAKFDPQLERAIEELGK